MRVVARGAQRRNSESERGRQLRRPYSGEPPQLAALSQRKCISKTHYRCRGAQGQHHDGVLFPLFQLPIHSDTMRKGMDCSLLRIA